jgi:membrane-associated phospholipid phosphatase
MYFYNLKKRAPYFAVLMIFILLFSVGQSPVLAKENSNEYRFNKKYLSNLRDDFVQVISSPKNWGKKDYLILSLFAVSTVALFAVEEEIYDWFQENRTSSSDKVSDIASSVGNGLFIIPMLATFYTAGEIFRSKGLRKTALMCLESFITSGILVVGLKFLTGRARPYRDEGTSTFFPFSVVNGYHSFPSGHASTAFGVASVIADQSGSFFIDFFAYGTAATIALSRIHNSKHWPSDVFIGSALGYFIGKKICRLNDKRDAGKIDVGFQMSPRLQAVSLSFRF